MGDVNLEIKLNNIDERLTNVEEHGGGSGGTSYIETVSTDFKVVNKKLSLSDIVKTAITSISNKLNKPQSANDGDALVFDSDSQEWLPKQIEAENYINDVSDDFTVVNKLLALKDAIKNKINSIGDITQLGTVVKTDIVSAINSLTVGGVNNGIYTESEIVIGQWLGKPLYRRVYKLHPVNMDAGYDIDAPSNIDICINIYGFIKQQSYTIPYGFYNGTNAWLSAFYRSGKIEIRGASEYSNNDTYCIIEYTKTTD